MLRPALALVVLLFVAACGDTSAGGPDTGDVGVADTADVTVDVPIDLGVTLAPPDCEEGVCPAQPPVWAEACPGERADGRSDGPCAPVPPRYPPVTCPAGWETLRAIEDDPDSQQFCAVQSAHNTACWGYRASPEFGTDRCRPWTTPCNEDPTDAEIRALVPGMEDAEILHFAPPTMPEFGGNDAIVVLPAGAELEFDQSDDWPSRVAFVSTACDDVPYVDISRQRTDTSFTFRGLRVRLGNGSEVVALTLHETEIEGIHVGFDADRVSIRDSEFGEFSSLTAHAQDELLFENVAVTQVSRLSIASANGRSELRNVSIVSDHRGVDRLELRGRTTVDGLYFEKASNAGVRFDTTEADVTNLHVRSVHENSVEDSVAVEFAGGTVTASGVVIDSSAVGLLQRSDAVVSVTDLVVRDTFGFRRELGAPAVWFESSGTLERATILRPSGSAVAVSGSSITLRDISVFGAKAVTETSGVAIWLFNQSGSGGDATLERVLLRDSALSALAIHGLESTISDLAIDGVMLEGPGRFGLYFDAQAPTEIERLSYRGASVSAPISFNAATSLEDFHIADLTMPAGSDVTGWLTTTSNYAWHGRRGLIHRFSHLGVGMFGPGPVTFEDTRFEEAQTPTVGWYGAIHAQALPLTLRRVQVRGMNGIALTASGVDLTLSDVLVRETDDAAVLNGGRALHIDQGSEVSAERLQVARAYGAGVIVQDSVFDGTDVWIAGVGRSGQLPGFGLVTERSSVSLARAAIGDVSGVGLVLDTCTDAAIDAVSIDDVPTATSGSCAEGLSEDGSVEVGPSVGVHFDGGLEVDHTAPLF